MNVITLIRQNKEPRLNAEMFDKLRFLFSEFDEIRDGLDELTEPLDDDIEEIWSDRDIKLSNWESTVYYTFISAMRALGYKVHSHECN